MSYHLNELWLCYLVHILVNKCIKLSKDKCPGCKDELNSPLLHYHIQLSLLEKIKFYMEEVRGPMMKKIGVYFEGFSKISKVEDANENNYLFTGQTFLLMASAESIYYGRYLTEDTYCMLFPKPKPTMLKVTNNSYTRSAPSSTSQGSKNGDNKRRKVEKKKKQDDEEPTFEIPMHYNYE